MNEKRLRSYIMQYKPNIRRLNEISSMLSDSSVSVTAAYGERIGSVASNDPTKKMVNAIVRNEKLRKEYREIAEQVQVVKLAIGICLDSEDETHQILFTVIDSDKGLRKIAFDMGITYQQARTRFDKAIRHVVTELERDRNKVL